MFSQGGRLVDERANGVELLLEGVGTAAAGAAALAAFTWIAPSRPSPAGGEPPRFVVSAARASAVAAPHVTIAGAGRPHDATPPKLAKSPAAPARAVRSAPSPSSPAFSQKQACARASARRRRASSAGERPEVAGAFGERGFRVHLFDESERARSELEAVRCGLDRLYVCERRQRGARAQRGGEVVQCARLLPFDVRVRAPLLLIPARAPLESARAALADVGSERLLEQLQQPAVPHEHILAAASAALPTASSASVRAAARPRSPARLRAAASPYCEDSSLRSPSTTSSESHEPPTPVGTVLEEAEHVYVCAAPARRVGRRAVAGARRRRAVAVGLLKIVCIRCARRSCRQARASAPQVVVAAGTCDVRVWVARAPPSRRRLSRCRADLRRAKSARA